MAAGTKVPLKYCYVFINPHGVTYHIVIPKSIIIIIIIIIIGYQIWTVRGATNAIL
jgi:hypothetical protein